MNRRQLVDALTARLGDEQVADAALTAVVETITDAVARGEVVDLGGFGTFTRELLRAWVAPGPDGPIEIPATRVPRFEPGSSFSDAAAVRRSRT